MADVTPKYGLPFPESGDFMNPAQVENLATAVENLISQQTVIDSGSLTPVSTDWAIFNSILVKQGKIVVAQIVAQYLGANPITVGTSGNINDTPVANLSNFWLPDVSGPLSALNWRGSGGTCLGSTGGALINSGGQISITDMVPPNSTITKNDTLNIYGSYPIKVQ